jgi:hypothetical protein
MTRFIGTSLRLQSITTAHNQLMLTTHSVPYWTTSVFSSTVPDLVLIYESVTSSASVNTPQLNTQLSYEWRTTAHCSLSWFESSLMLRSTVAPIWGLRSDFCYCQTVAGLLMWGALSDERTGLSFTIVAGPRQRSHSHVRVLWDSQSYFTFSDSRLPFLSPPTTRRATVEVFEPASTRDTLLN